MTSTGTWLLLMIWIGTHTGGVSGPGVVPFESEAVCRLVGTQYENKYSYTARQRRSGWQPVSLVEWRCVFNGN